MSKIVEQMHAVSSKRGVVSLYAENDDGEIVIEVPRHRIRAVLLTCLDAIEKEDSIR